MRLTITCATPPATDLGYLLAKHPARLQHFEVSKAATAHVFYTAATTSCCSATLLVDVDPLAHARSAMSVDGAYVSDRPYATASLLSTAIAQVLRSGLQGRCAEWPALPEQPRALTVDIVPLHAQGGEAIIRQMFEPLGYAVSACPCTVDVPVPDGTRQYFAVTLAGQVRLCDLLRHLYILLPVIDGFKHYWVYQQERDKFDTYAGAWIGQHPAAQQIILRAFRRVPALARSLLEQYVPAIACATDAASSTSEPPRPLALLRREAVITALRTQVVRSVADLGCGGGHLLLDLVAAGFAPIFGGDVSRRALQGAAHRLRKLPSAQRDAVRLLQTAVTYHDTRLAGVDAVTLVEVVEHLGPAQLRTCEQVVFGMLRPRVVVITTPNVSYNVAYGIAAGKLRHTDHRFEWTPDEFWSWAGRVSSTYGYRVECTGVGAEVEDIGAPTSMGVFVR